MANFHLTNKAVEDLNGIWNYTVNNWSEPQADKYYQMLLNRCQDIADSPKIGKNYNGITSDLFGLKVNHHVIFYRIISADYIEITRILHGRMDLKARIKE